MREIKFRVWDSKEKSMIEWDDIKASNSIFIWINANNRGTEHPLMQYTGLHDKNGKEIYEGDIVKAKIYKPKEPVVGLVRYLTYTTHFTAGFCLVSKYSSPTEYIWSLKSGIETEVIGNIHENPELLE